MKEICTICGLGRNFHWPFDPKISENSLEHIFKPTDQDNQCDNN